MNHKRIFNIPAIIMAEEFFAMSKKNKQAGNSIEPPAFSIGQISIMPVFQNTAAN